MADTSKDELPGGEEQSTQQGAGGGRLAALAAKLFTRKGLAIILAVSVGVHALGFAYYHLRSESRPAGSGGEVSLGEFEFNTPNPAPGQVSDATFSLHLALLREVDGPARQRLRDHAFRVQQDVEELLRRAHAADFDDPALAELKHQLQEQIDRTLELRAIADVIITDLELKRTPEAPTSIPDTTETASWTEPPTGSQ